MNAWMKQWFDGKQQSVQGGVLRRSRYYVDKYTSMQAVVNAARARGWHVVETGDQVVVLCNDGDIKVHC